MSATDQMRDMISQLMGTDPSIGDGPRSHYTDPQVCRSFLLSTCPHEVLNGTRMDIGSCPKVHDVALRADYQKAAKAGSEHFYDLDALEHLERFFADCDRKTEAAKKRLEETQEELSDEMQGKADKVLAINEQIGQSLADAEKLGNEGKVEESLKMLEKVEELRKQKTEADLDYRNAIPASSYQQQKLRVCEVCSAYLGIHDNDRRLADHFGGKLHIGFVFLRDKLAELRSTSEERKAAREAHRRAERSRRDHEPPSSRRDYSSRERERRSSRDRESSSRRRSRSRDRDQRDRDRKRRDSRERKRSRDRDRKRERPSSRDRDSSRRRREERKRSRSKSKEKSVPQTKSGSPASVESGELEEGTKNGSKKDVAFSDVD